MYRPGVSLHDIVSLNKFITISSFSSLHSGGATRNPLKDSCVPGLVFDLVALKHNSPIELTKFIRFNYFGVLVKTKLEELTKMDGLLLLDSPRVDLIPF